jgi:hypothetical protein
VVSSQNGWPVDSTGAKQDRNPVYGDIKVPNGVLEGDVATVLRWVARRWNDTVEPLVAGSCWGWFVKNIEGSSTISNHASGTAIDLNADQHPMGIAASKNMTAKQITACHAIEAASGGVVRWGGDFSRPDPMHWEIVGSAAATAAFAKKLGSEEDDMLVKKGDSGEEVKFWQMVLNDVDDAKLTVDGDYGAATENAVNASRKARGQGPNPAISGWHAFVLLRDMAADRAGATGKTGPAGPTGPQGPQGPAGPKGDPGLAGAFSGTLTVTGGQLDVESS